MRRGSRSSPTARAPDPGPMIREAYYLLRYGFAVRRRRREMDPVEFRKDLARRWDAEGLGELRSRLVGDLQGDVLEVGAGTGATFGYYGNRARVTAVEPYGELRAAAAEASQDSAATIRVVSAEGEKLPFDKGTFDAVSASTVLCSVASPVTTLAEFRRVLRPGGQVRLLEHVRSEHWLAGPMMDLSNPLWLYVNRTGCHWNRRTVEDVESAGFATLSVEPHKIWSRAVPAAVPLRIIKAELPGAG